MNTAILATPGPSRWLAAALGIAAAFALGCLLRRWVPGSSVSVPTHTVQPAPRDSAAPAEAIAAPAPDPLTDEDFTNASAAFRAAMSGHTPEHDLLAAAERLLDAARTNEDFQRLVDLINTVPSEALIEPIAMAAFSRWAQIDPESAARAVDRVQSHQMKHGLAREVCRLWARRDAAQALAFFENGPPGFTRRLGPSNLFAALAETDPPGALTRARAWKNEAERINIMASVLAKWAATSPQEALAFARAEPNPAQRSVLLRGALSALPKDKAWAEAVASADLQSLDDRLTLKQILNGWSYKIEEPTAAILALPAGEGRDDLLKDVAIGAVMSDHQRAEALLEKMPDAATRQTWLQAIAQSHLRNGDHLRPLDALRLASQLPAGDAQTAIFREAGERWSEHDAPAASQWLVAQPPGPLRDTFLGEFVRGTFDSDPAAALTWTISISDEGKRARRLTELYPKWQQRDAPAAEAWIRQQSGLTDADRAALNVPPQ
jgi:hypothetical protein